MHKKKKHHAAKDKYIITKSITFRVTKNLSPSILEVTNDFMFNNLGQVSTASVFKFLASPAKYILILKELA